MGMTVTKIEKDMLFYCSNEEPWHKVCADNIDNFRTKDVFFEQLFGLINENYLEIVDSTAAFPTFVIEEMKKNAQSNDYYINGETDDGPKWKMITSDKGMKLIADYFIQR